MSEREIRGVVKNQVLRVRRERIAREGRCRSGYTPEGGWRCPCEAKFETECAVLRNAALPSEAEGVT